MRMLFFGPLINAAVAAASACCEPLILSVELYYLFYFLLPLPLSIGPFPSQNIDMPKSPNAPNSVPRVLLVIGHGRRKSLCHHLLKRVEDQLTAAGIEHETQDLLADGFDPVLRLEEGQEAACKVDPEQDRLTAAYQSAVCRADGYIIVHPVWWFAPPAILKGWVDRVLVDGVAMRQPAGGPPEGILSGRRALVLQTFNVDRIIDKVVFGSISRRFWRRAVFFPVGISKTSYFPVYAASTLNETTIQRVEGRLKKAVKAFAEQLR
jgi:NAD(P)H dehydrogenase (quinone)